MLTRLFCKTNGSVLLNGVGVSVLEKVKLLLFDSDTLYLVLHPTGPCSDCCPSSEQVVCCWAYLRETSTLDIFQTNRYFDIVRKEYELNAYPPC